MEMFDASYQKKKTWGIKIAGITSLPSFGFHLGALPQTPLGFSSEFHTL